jgi:hypothetical protein
MKAHYTRDYRKDIFILADDLFKLTLGQKRNKRAVFAIDAAFA